jgi:hypothetical protein
LWVKKVEVIAFSTEDLSVDRNINDLTTMRTIDDVLAFYTKNSVDFTNIEKWNREDLYY